MINERFLRRALILFALIALGAGLVASVLGQAAIANWVWTIGTVPMIVALCVSIFRDLMRGGWASMPSRGRDERGGPSWRSLAAIVVAVMYAGGNVLRTLPSPGPNAISNPWWTVHRARISDVKTVVLRYPC